MQENNLTSLEEANPTEFPEPPEPTGTLLNPNQLMRVEHGDRNQCEATHANYQCPYRAMGTRQLDGTWKGPKYCTRHARVSSGKDDSSLRMYRVAQWQEAIQNKADHPRLKSLREEIGILKLTLESKLEQIKNPIELSMRSKGIIQLVDSIRDTIKTAQHLEKDLGILFDKTQLIGFVSEIIEIITLHVKDPETLQNISLDCMMSLERLVPEQRQT